MLDYERVLAPLREKPVRVLEIGVLEGASCDLWSDFFSHPESRVIGIDTALPSGESRENPKVVFKRCDQNDSHGLKEVARDLGPFDVVIDDGSHRFDETLNCYRVFFEYIRPGGYYVIEDWGVGYWKHQQHIYGGQGGKTMVTLITTIMESIPAASISGYQVILETHKCLAFFRKGNPWQS